MLYLTKGKHPARYSVFKDGRGGIVRVYIWNITHGGAGRKKEEYRIQVTGFDKFEPEPKGRTLILGWWEDVGVFAGWDYRHHTGKLGGSPSMQVSEEALRKALLSGFSPYINQKGETAIAFRPDFAGTYVEFLESLHDSGAIPKEAQLLDKLSEDPDDVSDADIDSEIDAKRKFAVHAAKRALRANDFSRRVLGAYQHRCAMCDMQLRLIDGAHIVPVEHSGNDQTSNGIALCALHHRAYDRSLVTFDPDFKVHVNEGLVKRLDAEDRAGGLKDFRDRLRPIINLPPDKKDRPKSLFVARANSLRGWALK
ncbi:HNH endonuclease [Roseibium aggregatum]|uniref:HNH endonuclease n=1 Tax=Roseibium aggregatum TaxID=187304 RepID=UPI0012F4B036|nr:HNH endonuclease [Roseibium aggregatum]